MLIRDLKTNQWSFKSAIRICALALALSRRARARKAILKALSKSAKFSIIVLALIFSQECAAINIIDSKDRPKNVLHMPRIIITRIFTKKLVYWYDGLLINNVYIKPMNSIEHQDFLAKYLHMTLFTYQKYLDTATYTAKTTPVIQSKTDAEMEALIKHNPGSIGYVNFKLLLNNNVVICDDC